MPATLCYVKTGREIHTYLYSTGGVAVVFRTSKIKMKEIEVKLSDFKVICANFLLPQWEWEDDSNLCLYTTTN